MRKIAFLILFLASILEANSQAGYFKPRYMGFPTDSNAWQNLTWNPLLDRAVWMTSGSGDTDSVFVIDDEICVVYLGDTVCVSPDSFYLDGDTSLCVISMGDTICQPYSTSAGNIYTIDGTIDDATRRVSIPHNSNFYLQRKENGSGNYSYFWIQPDNAATLINMSQLSNVNSQAVLEMRNLGTGAIFQSFNGLGANEDFAFGVNTSANSLVIAEGEDPVTDPWMTFHSAGDSIVIEKNLLTSGSALKIRSNNTGAASNTQKALEIDLEGANSNASQITYGGYFSNTHTGTSPINYGVYGTVSGASGAGVYGENTSSSGTGVYGVGATGALSNGVLGQAPTGRGVSGGTTSGTAVYADAGTSGNSFAGTLNSASANSAPTMLLLSRNTSGTPANGIGLTMEFEAETSTTPNQFVSSIRAVWEDVTHASRLSAIKFRGTSGSTADEMLILYGDKRIIFEGRASSTGDAATAANDLTLSYVGNVFTVQGSTQINAITSTGWQYGSEITLIFENSPTVKNNTAGGGGTAPILLAGGLDFGATANDVLKLVFNGINWLEVSRSAN